MTEKKKKRRIVWIVAIVIVLAVVFWLLRGRGGASQTAFMSSATVTQRVFEYGGSAAQAFFNDPDGFAGFMFCITSFPLASRIVSSLNPLLRGFHIKFLL